MVVPVQAIATEGGQPVAFVVEGGKGSRRPLSLGTRGATEVLVLSGVEAGETVATSNLGMLQDGTEVAP